MCAHFSPNRLALNPLAGHLLMLLLLVIVHRHRRHFRGALPSGIQVVSHVCKVITTCGRRLLRVVECLVLVEHFIFADKDAVCGG